MCSDPEVALRKAIAVSQMPYEMKIQTCELKTCLK